MSSSSGVIGHGQYFARKVQLSMPKWIPHFDSWQRDGPIELIRQEDGHARDRDDDHDVHGFGKWESRPHAGGANADDENWSGLSPSAPGPFTRLSGSAGDALWWAPGLCFSKRRGFRSRCARSELGDNPFEGVPVARRDDDAEPLFQVRIR